MLNRVFSLRLAQTLLKSLPQHPLFWHSLTLYSNTAEKAKPRGPQWRKALIRLGVGIGVLMACLSGYVLIVGLFLLPTLLVFAVLFGGTAVGTHAAVGIAGRIASEDERGRYDLLGMTPPGLIGASWALAASFLRTNWMAVRLRSWLSVFFGIGLLMMGLYALQVLVIVAVSLPSLVQQFSPGYDLASELFFQLETAGNLALVALFLRMDFTQSLVGGVLAGILAAALARGRVDTSLTALGLFLAVQFGSYALIVFADIIVAGRLLSAAGFADLLSGAIMVALALAIREAGLVALWRVVSHYLNTDSDELMEITTRTAWARRT